MLCHQWRTTGHAGNECKTGWDVHGGSQDRVERWTRSWRQRPLLRPSGENESDTVQDLKLRLTEASKSARTDGSTVSCQSRYEHISRSI